MSSGPLDEIGKHFLVSNSSDFYRVFTENSDQSNVDTVRTDNLNFIDSVQTTVDENREKKPLEEPQFDFELKHISIEYFALDSLFVVGDTSAALAYLQKHNLNVNWEYNYWSFLYRYARGERNHKHVKPSSAIVKFLLDHGANPNQVINKPTECGLVKVYPVSCDRDIAALLTKAGSKYQLNQNILCAAKNEDKAAIVQAIVQGGDPTFALYFAYQHDRQFFLELLEKKVDLNEALEIACDCHPQKTVEEYSEERSLGFTYHWYRFSLPYPPRDIELMKMIVKKGGDPNLPLIWAAMNNNGLFQFLLKEGADKSKALVALCNTRTPDVTLIENLVKNGARLNAPATIVYSNDEKVKKILLPATDGEAFSDLNEGGDGCESYESEFLYAWLRVAGLRGEVGIQNGDLVGGIEFMLKAGANPNVFYHDLSREHSDKLGCDEVSALGIAFFSGNQEFVKLLKKYGAKLPKGCSGKTPEN